MKFPRYLIDETVELHKSAVLPQVIFRFTHHGVTPTIRTLQAYLLWLLQRGQDLHLHKQDYFL